MVPRNLCPDFQCALLSFSFHGMPAEAEFSYTSLPNASPSGALATEFFEIHRENSLEDDSAREQLVRIMCKFHSRSQTIPSGENVWKQPFLSLAAASKHASHNCQLQPQSPVTSTTHKFAPFGYSLNGIFSF